MTLCYYTITILSCLPCDDVRLNQYYCREREFVGIDLRYCRQHRTNATRSSHVITICAAKPHSKPSLLGRKFYHMGLHRVCSSRPAKKLLFSQANGSPHRNKRWYVQWFSKLDTTIVYMYDSLASWMQKMLVFMLVWQAVCNRCWYL